ncbi:hypothetical protein [Fictibacillus barbaricus]|uniref:Uncharacterized protein n=1 Tax=Fictibacillus barbaricus TaxID=182136 RepID=A0ABU1TWG5_9BACL|nr:hypothetical protein [Fictibacillus barbaricus]MDR7071514.1 hypothetical protein [Fictibacillus barbaricus]
MKKSQGKFRPIFIPVVFFLIVFSILTSQNLANEKELPSKGWSRSLPLHTGTFGEVKPAVYEENGRYHVYVPKENEVLSFFVNDKLQVSDKKTTPVSIPGSQNFWTDRREFIFVKGTQLIHFDGKQEQVLDKNVLGMDSNKSTIIYFKQHEILSVDPATFKVQSVDKVKEDLKSVALNSSSKSFVIKSIYLDPFKKVKAVFYEYKNAAFYKHVLLNTDEAISENHFSFYFVENGSDLTVYYLLFNNASGGKSYHLYHGTNQLNANTDWKFEPMTFTDKDGVELENPKFVQYGVDENNQVRILFTTRAKKSIDKEAVNVYEVKQKGDSWLTERRSTTNYNSIYPHWIGNHSIMWMNMTGQDEFTYSGASTNKDIVEKSLITTNEDIKQATSRTILSMFKGLILGMSALYWVAPAVLFAIVIYFVKLQLMEDEDKRVKYAILALYLGVQLIFVQTLFNDHFYFFAPDFLTFSGSSFVLPVLIALISGIAVLLGKRRNWGMLATISYFVVVNIIFLSLTVGPYMF